MQSIIMLWSLESRLHSIQIMCGQVASTTTSPKILCSIRIFCWTISCCSAIQNESKFSWAYACSWRDFASARSFLVSSIGTQRFHRMHAPSTLFVDETIQRNGNELMQLTHSSWLNTFSFLLPDDKWSRMGWKWNFFETSSSLTR